MVCEAAGRYRREKRAPILLYMSFFAYFCLTKIGCDLAKFRKSMLPPVLSLAFHYFLPHTPLREKHELFYSSQHPPRTVGAHQPNGQGALRRTVPKPTHGLLERTLCRRERTRAMGSFYSRGQAPTCRRSLRIARAVFVTCDSSLASRRACHAHRPQRAGTETP